MSYCGFALTLLMLCNGILLHTSHGNEDSVSHLKTMFESLLQLNDIDLTSEEKGLRFPLFMVNCLAEKTTDGNSDSDPCPDITPDDMYTKEELEGMNGARKEDSVPREFTIEGTESLSKREVTAVPSSYDVRDHIKVSKPAYQGICGNCYVHAFVSALEIAYTKQTGKLVHFSRQELTDCFYKGCRGGDFRVLADMVASTDHLATASNYGSYLAQHTNNQFTCKAALTPDSLLDVKVDGYRSLTADELDYYLYTYGSVMTCMKWKESPNDNCGRIEKIKKGEIFEADEVKDGCDHAVLIVGYTPDYYIVKNSHGVSWGDGGYFKIKRGLNVCGIEDSLVVLISSPRSTPKALAPNHCPLSHPTYCSNSFSCTSSRSCVDTFQTARRRKRSLEDEDEINNRRKRSTCSDKAGQPRCQLMKTKGLCAANPSVSGVYCQLTCGTCSASTLSVKTSNSCVDKSPKCDKLPDDLCSTTVQVKVICPRKCNACEENPVKLEVVHQGNSLKQPHGPCPTPVVVHGKVVTPGNRNYLKHGETLVVECDPGYVKIGERVRCVVQDVFNPDSRLMSQCVEDTLSEVLSGNGADYDGRRSVSVSGKKCLNWRKELNAGSVFLQGVEALTFTDENHNFCRNKNGLKPVPYCLVDNSAAASKHLGGDQELKYALVEPEFCFSSPGCDQCAGNLKDIRPDCKSIAQQGVCKYRQHNSWEREQYYWKYCSKSCCRTTDCILLE